MPRSKSGFLKKSVNRPRKSLVVLVSFLVSETSVNPASSLDWRRLMTDSLEDVLCSDLTP